MLIPLAYLTAGIAIGVLGTVAAVMLLLAGASLRLDETLGREGRL